MKLNINAIQFLLNIYGNVFHILFWCIIIVITVVFMEGNLDHKACHRINFNNL